jgi:hypothetical protein
VDPGHTDHGIVNCMHIGYPGVVNRGPHISSTYQHTITEEWYKHVLFSNLLDWFDRAHNKFDHRASMGTLDLIL